MLSASFYYFKNLTRSALLYVMLLCIAGLLYSMWSTASLDDTFTTYFYYGFIVVNLYFLLAATLLMSKPSAIQQFLERSIVQKQCAILGALFIINLLMVIGISIILLTLGQQVTPSHLLHFAIVFTLSNLLAATIGSFFSAVLPRIAALLVALLVYAFFIWHSLQNDSMISAFERMLTIYDDSMMRWENLLIGEVFDTSYIIDKLGIVLLIVMIISLLGCLKATFKKWQLLGGLLVILSIACLSGLLSMSDKQAQFFDDYTPTKKFATYYTITDYTMNVNLQKGIQNDVILQITAKKDAAKIPLQLSRYLTVDTVTVDGQAVPYHTSHDHLVIEHTLKQQQHAIVAITYHGQLHVQGDFGVPIVYTNDAINLLGAHFAWYPQNNQKTAFHYKVTVSDTTAPLYTNLHQVNTNHYEGKSNVFSFVSSPKYKRQSYQGIDYIVPKKYDVKIYAKSIKALVKESPGTNAHYQQVISTYWTEYDEEYMVMENNILFVDDIGN